MREEGAPKIFCVSYSRISDMLGLIVLRMQTKKKKKKNDNKNIIIKRKVFMPRFWFMVLICTNMQCRLLGNSLNLPFADLISHVSGACSNASQSRTG